MKLSLSSAVLCSLLLTSSCANSDETAAPPAKGNQLLNLNETPTKPRFKVTDRVWPAKAGEASICLWNDDKMAAFSITIDDNPAQDVEWWLEKSREMNNIPLTWFLITSHVGKNSGPGKWDLWQKAAAAGHAIESHTVTHLHPEKPEWKGIESEYADSITAIDANIPNHRVGFMAYPGGPNTKLNDRNIAAKYYLAVRGARGTPNPAAQIDYLGTCAMSSHVLDDPKIQHADLRNLFNPVHRSYRGWAILLYHGVNDKPAEQKFFDFYKTNASELWGATFGDVALYGQERDTATLIVEENTANRITFSLADLMDDTRYTFPLTVKVHLPDTWKGANATQGGKAIEAKVAEHEGAKYALVKAVPDKGIVALTPG